MKKQRNYSVYLLFIILYGVLLLLTVLGYQWVMARFGVGLWLVVFGLVWLALLALAIFATIQFSRSLKTKIQQDAVQVSLMQRQYLEQWDCAYAVMDHAGKLIWYNREFGRVFNQSASIETQTFFQLIENDTLEVPPSEVYPTESQIEYNGAHYFIRIQMIHREETQEAALQMYAVSMEDITRQIELERENDEMRAVICLIYLDNFETISNRMEESQRPMLEAMIYRKLSNMAAGLNGILTRLERDRFFLVFPNRSLKELEENRFHILTEIRQVASSSSLPLTLSIGVGVADHLNEAQEYARAAVDLAMGRGGDQAVVKNDEKYTFYGGSSMGVEKNSRARARLVAYALKELISDCDRVLIMGHKNPDLDCFGAAIGVYRIVTELKKTANIVLGDTHPAIDTLIERTRQEPEYQNVLISEAEAEALSGENTLVIVVDVNRPSIIQHAKLLELNKNVAVIDHHRVSADHIERAAVSYIEPYASSASEMVTEVLQYIDERIRLKPIEADALFSGMQLDTKTFTVKTGVRTFEAAAYLRRNGADAVRVRKLFKNDMNEYKAKAHIVSQAVMMYDSIAISRWKATIPGANIAAAQAADELLNISGIRASFVLTETQGQVGFSARSLGDINVQVIMEKLGGGGHMMMAGAQLKDTTLDEAEQKLEAAIEEYLGENRLPFVKKG